MTDQPFMQARLIMFFCVEVKLTFGSNLPSRWLHAPSLEGTARLLGKSVSVITAKLWTRTLVSL